MGLVKKGDFEDMHTELIDWLDKKMHAFINDIELGMLQHITSFGFNKMAPDIILILILKKKFNLDLKVLRLGTGILIDDKEYVNCVGAKTIF